MRIAPVEKARKLWGAGGWVKLERLQEKWNPVFRPQTRKNKELEQPCGSTEPQGALSGDEPVKLIFDERRLNAALRLYSASASYIRGQELAEAVVSVGRAWEV